MMPLLVITDEIAIIASSTCLAQRLSAQIMMTSLAELTGKTHMAERLYLDWIVVIRCLDTHYFDIYLQFYHSRSEVMV